MTGSSRPKAGSGERQQPAKSGHSRELLQCVDTHASLFLTTGIASIDWIVEQMGHTNGNMIRQHYGTWINQDGPDMVGMLQLALKLSPVTAQH